nr:hypothetical protein [Tanacetum cinerariifolium]
MFSMSKLSQSMIIQSKMRLKLIKSTMMMQNKVSCIMAASMSHELQKTFEFTWAYEMNLKEMFQAKASKECHDKGKATKGKSNRGSKRKAKYDIAPTSDLKEAVCFYCNEKGHWKRICPKFLKDLKDRKVEKGSHSEESFGYLFYKPKDNVVFVAQRGVFLEREMISKVDIGSEIDLKEIYESADKEPIVNIDTQQEVVTPVEPEDIYLPIQDMISNSTLSKLDEPANYKEAMASPEAAKWKEAMKSKIQSMYDNQVWNLVDSKTSLKTVGYKWIFKNKTDIDGKMDVKTAFLNRKLTEDVFMVQPEGFENA